MSLGLSALAQMLILALLANAFLGADARTVDLGPFIVDYHSMCLKTGTITVEQARSACKVPVQLDSGAWRAGPD